VGFQNINVQQELDQLDRGELRHLIPRIFEKVDKEGRMDNVQLEGAQVADQLHSYQCLTGGAGSSSRSAAQRCKSESVQHMALHRKVMGRCIFGWSLVNNKEGRGFHAVSSKGTPGSLLRRQNNQ
jgi:hypothetical protein